MIAHSLPLLLLVPPLAVTLLGGRSAWLWLSTAIGYAILWAIGIYVLRDWTYGGSGGLFAPLFDGMFINLGFRDLYHATSYVHFLGSLAVVPFLMGALLFLRAHPRRTRIDIALFWGVISLLMIINLGPLMYFRMGEMPRRYSEYSDQLDTLNMLISGAAVVTCALLLTAAIRPLYSTWQARRAR